MTTVPTSIWDLTPGMTQRLAALHAAPENYSSSEMADMLSDEFGIVPPLTRNAVIGKSRRMSMPPRPLKIRTGPKLRQEPWKPTPLADTQPRCDEPLTIYQLGYGDCKYPVEGDAPPYLYCGKQSDEGRSYCPPHYALTHHPAKRVWE